ncbi:hypothetical protein P9222_28415 [Paenibacillus amylolyticus]|nr:hypothetical protein [Paenibacillus amylolyticus]WFR62136.1 hypothetical protein P9222_28415 [Paenibacillus amylolyticus]
MEQGKRIVVSPIPGADEKKVRLFILGTCMAVIMMQRGILPLHGSAVVIDGWAYAFVGYSGAGKSTLSAALASRGYPLLTDDVVALTWDAGEEPSYHLDIHSRNCGSPVWMVSA